VEGKGKSIMDDAESKEDKQVIKDAEHYIDNR